MFSQSEYANDHIAGDLNTVTVVQPYRSELWYTRRTHTRALTLTKTT